MNGNKVESSNIDAIGWENNVLGIRFKHGGVYEYQNVEKSVFEAMLNAQSKGKFFHANISKQYEFVKIGEKTR